VIFGENQIKILLFDEKTKKFSVLSEKTLNLTIFDIVISKDSLIIIDIFMKISIFSFNLSLKSLDFSHQANFVGSLQNSGVFCENSLFLTNFLDKSLLIVKNVAKRLEIENEWKLREIPLSFDNFEEIQENFIWKGVLLATNIGNLQVLLKINEGFYENLKKIEGFLREKEKIEGIFDYENSRKLRINVIFI